MSVSYDKAIREQAKIKGQNPVTIAVAGMEFQGCVSDEERNKLLHYLLDLQERVSAAQQPKEEPSAKVKIA